LVTWTETNNASGYSAKDLVDGKIITARKNLGWIIQELTTTGSDAWSGTAAPSAPNCISYINLNGNFIMFWTVL
jgi:hypothetical protein